MHRARGITLYLRQLAYFEVLVETHTGKSLSFYFLGVSFRQLFFSPHLTSKPPESRMVSVASVLVRPIAMLCLRGIRRMARME